MAAAVVRYRIYVQGIVQGVGFRPFVFGLARRHGLAGFVRNEPGGVALEVEGPEPALAAFLAALRDEAPPLARIERLAVERVLVLGEAGFRIEHSRQAGERQALISPDVATCEACLRELFDPADRRYGYPFINCTNCGPRYTIVVDVPYDRPNTTMGGFTMCADCDREYHDPLDRRFHAQPNACPACGPRVTLVDPAGRPIPCPDPIVEAATRLRRGQILAVKGLGGYHLACDTADEAAVRRLREQKHREHKPFALMVPDLDWARRLCFLSEVEERLLCSRRRPIVLARRRPEGPVAPSVAPGCRDLGLMLPYTPLHHLLLVAFRAPLVMTSGNRSDEPIAYRDGDALARLGPMVDALLVHDRPIHVRCDDSVTRAVLGHELPVRRSRGYAPEPLALPFAAPVPLLATGAMLKNVFALCKGRHAFLSHHVGDLDHYEARRAFAEAVRHLMRLFDVDPRAVAHDLHPDYPTTEFALALEGVERVAVQHHHAHVAAVMAEWGLSGPVLGVAYDGTGYGPDGTVWGGEILLADGADFRRVAHLKPVPMPGGERAARDGWRMAAAWLWAAFGPEGEEQGAAVAERVGRDRWRATFRLLRSGGAMPVTSSVGRLFDAVASLAGIRDRSGYEGHGAVELEMHAAQGQGVEQPYPLRVEGNGPPLQLDASHLVRAVVADVRAGVPAPVIAARFHAAVAAAAAATLGHLREETGVDRVVLSGGVFQNVTLLELLVPRLREAGFAVYLPRAVPPNDGGLCVGQAAVAARRLAGGA